MNPTMDDVRAAYYTARAAGAAVEPGHVNPNDPRSIAAEIARLNAARVAASPAPLPRPAPAPAPMFAPGARPDPGPLVARGTNGVVTFDGRAVTISRGVIRGAGHAGRGTKRIPLRQITSVQYKKPGLTHGNFVVTLPGDGATESVTVHAINAGAFAAMRDAVESAMLEA